MARPTTQPRSRYPDLVVIDDDDVDVESVRRAVRLEAPAFQVHVARDGLEGRDLLLRLPRDRCHVVLLDLRMPRRDGLELLSELRALPDPPPFVAFVLTTSAAAEDVRRAYALGVAGYFVKSHNFLHQCRQIELVRRYCEVVTLPV
jgi:DNA-binding NarL/FixJ family response regulator